VSNLDEAGIEGLDFQRSWLGKITGWTEDGCATEGWAFCKLVIPTAELLRIFPINDPSGNIAPAVIKLTSGCPEPSSASLPSPKLLFLGSAIDRVADRTGAAWQDAATAVYHALCARELTAESAAGDEIPSNVWRSFLAADFAERIFRSNDGGPWGADGRYINPSLTTQSVEFWLSQPSHEAPSCPVERAVPLDDDPTTEPAQPAVTLASLPPYVRFLVEMSDCIPGAGERKKEDIETEIRARWPDELRPASQALVGYMATMLRPPEAQRGGAKPSRPMSVGAE
jgi:hypothetical protein